MKRLALLLAVAIVAGCASRQPAPVVERMPAPPPPVVEAPAPPPEPPVEKPVPTHTVKRGETLATIALMYGLDYRELAAWNNIVNPNRIEVGRVLVIAAPAGAQPLVAPVVTPLAGAGTPIESRPMGNTQVAKVEPRATKVPFSDKALAQMGAVDAGGMPVGADKPLLPEVAPPPVLAVAPPVAPAETTPGADREDIDWMWPVKGKVIAPFTEAGRGMDIGGKKGTAIVAAAGGRVIYAGDLRGYGRLVIIKHNDVWLSAYAHNENIVVKEQQDVRKGQKIAEMGSTDTDQVKLHFEVRRQGKPVDPLKILPAK